MIAVVVVLYRMAADESPAIRSLTQHLPPGGRPGGFIDLIICDNTPFEQAAPTALAGRYLRDPSNPGLARRYNEALGIADKSGAAWLMLLDQDTTVTAEYLDEVLAEAASCADRPEVVALVPKLIERGAICSPIHPPTYKWASPVGAEFSGIAAEILHVFNSGAVLRVSAVQAMGGFPQDFPLDYLDHATFTELQHRGGKLHVLRSALEHQLSSNDETRRGAAFARRQRSVLDAEYRFYNRYGSARDRALRRVRLLRACAGRLARGKDWSQTWRILKSAVRP
jgi:GT2 family glycosyltransferase